MFTVESGDLLVSISSSLSSDEDMIPPDFIILTLLQDVLSVVLAIPNVVTHFSTVHNITLQHITVHYFTLQPRVTFQA